MVHKKILKIKGTHASHKCVFVSLLIDFIRHRVNIAGVFDTVQKTKMPV